MGRYAGVYILCKEIAVSLNCGLSGLGAEF